jgi:hypothetical protein
MLAMLLRLQLNMAGVINAHREERIWFQTGR